MNLHEIVQRETPLLGTLEIGASRNSSNPSVQELDPSVQNGEFLNLQPIERLEILKKHYSSPLKEDALRFIRHAYSIEPLYVVRCFASVYMCLLGEVRGQYISTLRTAIDGSARDCDDVVCATLFFESILTLAKLGLPETRSIIDETLSRHYSFTGARAKQFEHFVSRVQRQQNET